MTPLLEAVGLFFNLGCFPAMMNMAEARRKSKSENTIGGAFRLTSRLQEITMAVYHDKPDDRHLLPWSTIRRLSRTCAGRLSKLEEEGLIVSVITGKDSIGV